MCTQTKLHSSARTVIALSLASCLIINPTLLRAQGFHITVGGGNRYSYRGGYSFHGNLPIGEWFKSGKLKFQESVLKGDVERASRWVKPDFVDDLIKDAPPICYSAARGNTRMVNLLVKNGASVERTFHGKSLVYIAAFYGQQSTAEALIDLGGGTREDLSAGRAMYAKNAQRQRVYAAAATVAALALIGGMIASQTGGETDEEAQRRELRMRQGSLLAIIPGW